MPFNYSIPELESKDEMFWHLFKAFRFLEQKDYSIRRFSINNDCISIDYFKKGWSINVSTSIPFNQTWLYSIRFLGISIFEEQVTDCSTANELALHIQATEIYSKLK